MLKNLFQMIFQVQQFSPKNFINFQFIETYFFYQILIALNPIIHQFFFSFINYFNILVELIIYCSLLMICLVMYLTIVFTTELKFFQ